MPVGFLCIERLHFLIYSIFVYSILGFWIILKIRSYMLMSCSIIALICHLRSVYKKLSWGKRDHSLEKFFVHICSMLEYCLAQQSPFLWLLSSGVTAQKFLMQWAAVQASSYYDLSILSGRRLFVIRNILFLFSIMSVMLPLQHLKRRQYIFFFF